MNLNIQFENENFIVLFKPAAVLTVPSRLGQKEERPILGLLAQSYLQQQNKNLRIYPVHRLDFEVSGLVLFAKNESAHQKSNAWFENKIVKKKYKAVTSPQDFTHWPLPIDNPREKIEVVKNHSFTWQNKIEKGKRRAFQSPRGKDTLTQAKILNIESNFIFWDLEPVTGRSHQLRFELSFRGFPIIGDALYGSNNALKEKDSIALVSDEINFSKVSLGNRLGLPETILATHQLTHSQFENNLLESKSIKK